MYLVGMDSTRHPKYEAQKKQRLNGLQRYSRYHSGLLGVVPK